PEAGVGLDVDLPSAAEAVEVVDVVAAQECLECVEDVGESYSHRPHFGAVDLRVELGRPGAEAVEQADEAWLLVAFDGHFVCPGLERVVVYVAGGLHHQLEAAGVAEAPDRRRSEDEHAGLQDLALEALADTRRDGLAG